MEHRPTLRGSRAEPQRYQGLNEPVEPALVSCFLDRWMQKGCENLAVGQQPATGLILAERPGKVQAGLQAHDLTRARPPATAARLAASAAQFNR